MRRFADDDGRELAPSPYWVESRRLLNAPEPTRRGVTGLIPAQAAVVSERDLDRRLALEHRPARPAIAAALARRARVRGLTRGLVQERVRVTALESYQACAYGWFVSGVLNPQPLEEQWDPAAEGTFGHKVLERTFTGLEKQNVGPCTRAALPRYLEAMYAALDEVEQDLRPPDAGRAFDAFVHGLRIRLEHRLVRGGRPRAKVHAHAVRAALRGGRCCARSRAHRDVRPHRPLARRPVRVRHRLQAQRPRHRQEGRRLSADPALRAHGRQKAGRPAGRRRVPRREQEGRRRARPRGCLPI